VGPLRVRACGGKVTEVWLEDLRVGPNCVTVNGVALDRGTPLAQVAARFAGCKELPAREGGSFIECENGGLRLGYGMGEFLQVRVAERGSSIDDTCEDTLGTHPPLTPTERSKLVERTLDQPALAKYWHANKAGRSPLQLVWEGGEPPRRTLHMFGEEVLRVSRAEAERSGKAYFEITGVISEGPRAAVAFRYAAEGISGRVRFRRGGADFVVEDVELKER